MCHAHLGDQLGHFIAVERIACVLASDILHGCCVELSRPLSLSLNRLPARCSCTCCCCCCKDGGLSGLKSPLCMCRSAAGITWMGTGPESAVGLLTVFQLMAVSAGAARAVDEPLQSCSMLLWDREQRHCRRSEKRDRRSHFRLNHLSPQDAETCPLIRVECRDSTSKASLMAVLHWSHLLLCC